MTALASKLEERFERLTMLLYDTRVPAATLDAEVLPYLAEQVRFTDPWQSGVGRRNYRLGAAGFHCAFRFDFEVSQVSVALDKDERSGRAIVDGVMKLKALAPFYTYPLRTMLVYRFQVTGEGEPLVTEHEEMWSVADMIEALPILGGVYARVFRPAFAQAFLVASRSCLWWRGERNRARDERLRTSSGGGV